MLISNKMELNAMQPTTENKFKGSQPCKEGGWLHQVLCANTILALKLNKYGRAKQITLNFKTHVFYSDKFSFIHLIDLFSHFPPKIFK